MVSEKVIYIKKRKGRREQVIYLETFLVFYACIRYREGPVKEKKHLSGKSGEEYCPHTL